VSKETAIRGAIACGLLGVSQIGKSAHNGRRAVTAMRSLRAFHRSCRLLPSGVASPLPRKRIRNERLATCPSGHVQLGALAYVFSSRISIQLPFLCRSIRVCRLDNSVVEFLPTRMCLGTELHPEQLRGLAQISLLDSKCIQEFPAARALHYCTPVTLKIEIERTPGKSLRRSG
jgi:hypothetical protein